MRAVSERTEGCDSAKTLRAWVSERRRLCNSRSSGVSCASGAEKPSASVRSR